MSKMPYIAFYVGDWHKDNGIRMLTLEEKGAWLELLIMMHESERKGYLQVNGMGIPEETLGKMLGIHGNKWKKIKRKFEDTNIFSVEPETGILYSRKMARDAEIKESRRESGKLGGNPNFEKGKPNPYYDKQKDNRDDKQKDKQNITISSSVSSSVSSSDLDRCDRETISNKSEQKEQTRTNANKPDPTGIPDNSPGAPKNLKRFKFGPLIKRSPDVWITEKHYSNLHDILDGGEKNTKHLIDRLQTHAADNPKKFKMKTCHHLTILNFDQMEKERGKRFFDHPTLGEGYFYERDIERAKEVREANRGNNPHPLSTAR